MLFARGIVETKRRVEATNSPENALHGGYIEDGVVMHLRVFVAVIPDDLEDDEEEGDRAEEHQNADAAASDAVVDVEASFVDDVESVVVELPTAHHGCVLARRVASKNLEEGS